MITKDKIDQLVELNMNAFSVKDADFISDMLDMEEFTSAQEKWIDDLYEKHFGKDDEKL